MDDQRLVAEASNLICPAPLDENFLAAIFNGLAESVFVVDLDTRCIIYWNGGAERMFGYSSEEALRRTTEFLQPDRAAFERMHQAAVPAIKNFGVWRGEWTHRRRDGSIFPAEIRATLIRTHPFTAMSAAVVVHDITERKELESEIHCLKRELAERVKETTKELTAARHELAEAAADNRLTAEKFHLLTDQVRDCAILMLDPEGRVTSWNSGAGRLFGYEEDEMIGKHCSLFYAEEESGASMNPEALQEAATQRTPDQHAHLMRRDGSRFYADVILAPFHDPKGALTNFSMIIRDVTERVAIRQKLREKEHLATMGTAASMFAHEVSNPLNSISTSIQLLERTMNKEDSGFSGKESALSFLNELNIEIRRLRSLLDEFRNLARTAVLNLRPLNLGVLVGELIKGTAGNLGNETIKLIDNVSASLPPVMGDSEKIKQALLNLIKNAAEAMPQGGTITIKGYESGANVCLDVEDTGIGIPDGTKIFEFFQTTKPEGMGLGLVIVQQIVAAHEGTISYTSQAGSGTTFHLCLPSITPLQAANSAAVK